jgi:hypothetical protein
MLIYFSTGGNITWNPNGPSNLKPIYSDNPPGLSTVQDILDQEYFLVTLDNKINDWLSAMVDSHLTLTVNYKKRINVGGGLIIFKTL